MNYTSEIIAAAAVMAVTIVGLSWLVIRRQRHRERHSFHLLGIILIGVLLGTLTGVSMRMFRQDGVEIDTRADSVETHSLAAR